MQKLLPLAALVALGACVGQADQQSAAEKPVPLALQGKAVGKPVDCITTTEIRDTEVVGDRVILFHMNNDRVYRNDLPYACPGLRQDQPFRYKVHTNRLCNIDIITPFDATTGISFGSCGLGQFTPYELPKDGSS